MKKHYFLLSLLASGIASVSATALAAQPAYQGESNLWVLNQNFESDLIDTKTHYNSNIIAWQSTGLGDTGVSTPLEDGEYLSPNEHGQVAFLQGGGELRQTLQVPLQDQMTYKATFDVGRPKNSQSDKLVAKFEAQGIVLAYSQIDIRSIPQGIWQSHSVQFSASSEMPTNYPISVSFLNRATHPGDTLHLDNVKVTQSGTPAALRVERTGMGLISENIVLRVPQDYSRISDALDELRKHFIQADKIATIKVANCTQQGLAEPLTIDHPQGENIHIIGNTEFPEKCQIYITGPSGFFVNEGKQLGLMDGFTLNKIGSGNTTAILASKNASVNLGENMVFNDFNSAIKAEKKAMVFANGVTFHNNNYDVEAFMGGIVQAENTTSTSNKSFGFYAHRAGRIYAEGAKVQNLEGSGFYALSQSYIDADNSDVTAKKRGFIAQRTSAISARNSKIQGTEETPVYAHQLAHINQQGSNASATSPELGVVNNESSTVK